MSWEFANTVIGLLGLLTAAGGGGWLIRFLAKRRSKLQTEEKVKEMQSLARRVARLQKAISAPGASVWLADDPAPPSAYRERLARSIPIILLANLKGGVGKTTIAANLAAHFSKSGKYPRVLCIDLDYQGSLSAMMQSKANRVAGPQIVSKATNLIDGKLSGAALIDASEFVGDKLPNVRLVPAFYDLATAENRIMIEWLIGTRKTDVRYHLAETLLSRQVQERFDMIIIDAPPRLTTGCVNALCASTHVFVPTVLDQLSGEAVATFANQVRALQKICPEINFAGVIGTMREHDYPAALKPHEQLAIEAINGQLHRQGMNNKMFPESAFIPDKINFGRNAGLKIAYVEDNTIVPIFDRLGAAVIARLRHDNWQAAAHA